MKLIKKITSLVLVITLLLTMTIPASAASFFTVHEVYGAAGRVYLTNHDDVPVRAEPHNGGAILDYLPNAYPVEALGMFRTWKGTLWVKIVNESYEAPEAWIFMGNLNEHTHSYINLEAYGHGKFEFCEGCGNIRPTSVDSFEVDLDNLQIALAACSLLPGVGNGFDVLDGLISLARGNYADAALSFASSVPILGIAGDAFRVGKTFDVVSDTASLTVALDRVDGVADMVKVRPEANYYKLKRNMNRMYDMTGDMRFYKLAGENIPKRSVAAHHIVAIGEEASEEAANILMRLGIDMNGASNGVFLCMKATVCEGTLHVTRHSPEYYASVNKLISDAYNGATGYANQRAAVIMALDDIARRLMTGDMSL